MTRENIVLPLKRFLLIQQCPAEWRSLNLYLFRDENVVFYVGQSQQAFARVWEHLMSGFKGNSMMGRFVWANWPASMRFGIELSCSQFEQYAHVGHELNASERFLIQHWNPCFNISLNHQPTALPSCYLPPNAPFKRRQSFIRLLHQAEQAVKADDQKHWLQDLEG